LLASLDQWWFGRDWLQSECISYSSDVALETVEVREVKIPSAAALIVESSANEWLLKYSSFNKLHRVIAYILRFLKNCHCQKKERITSPLMSEELKCATLKIVRMIQHTEYKQEIENLLHDIPVGKNSKLFGLHPFLDTNGLLRVGGCLANADIPYSEQHQVIVPPKHHMTKLLIVHEHERLLHAGSQQVLSSLRCNYWIPTGRNIVRLVLRKCLVL
jgi:hypothetical protein